MTFNSILEIYRTEAFSERDKGDRFERLMCLYLQTDPLYAVQFRHVWLWSEFFAKDELGGVDTGIDLVAMTHDGEYWAVQCKCYQESATIDKASVDSFLSTSSREFTLPDGKKTGFVHRLWISTTNKWTSNATEAIQNQHPPVSRIHLTDLEASGVDWAKLHDGLSGNAARTAKKELREHQIHALERTHEHFKTADRGKLIMACGTGKTFTALKIAEKETSEKETSVSSGKQGFVLFLVPSIALLGQTLREWAQEAEQPLNAVCICSDPAISQTSSSTRRRNSASNSDTDPDSFSTVDLALPASTDVKNILRQFEHIRKHQKTNDQATNAPMTSSGMTVVFSTYQSLEVVHKAQQALMEAGSPLGEFDLVICDEAHRTTGVTLADEAESAFVRIHDNEFIRAKKRLYMTATPRLYSDDSKSKAAQSSAVLCSMDDEKLYGQEIYRIGFGEAVEKGLLTDYKVLILTVSESDISPALQKSIADSNTEIKTDDAAKLIGCVNALSKLIIGDNGATKAHDPAPMRRAVAFCQNIKTSKAITDIYNTFAQSYLDDLPSEQRQQMVSVQSDHIDGSMAAPLRDEKLSWLKAETDDGTCRMLTNVRCLSEGVDVPSLDAVLFLSPRNSQIDVVQSVGRVMRRSPGKKFGYIIIPIVIPANVEAEKALDDNERYAVVWSVLNALKSHDDRFNATVNKIELNQQRPANIVVGAPGAALGDDDSASGAPPRGDATGAKADASTGKSAGDRLADQILMRFDELQNAIFARMVLKVGNRQYWEQWAKNIAEIAERQTERITRLVNDDGAHKQVFMRFVEGLRQNINPAVSETEAVEMLAQHIITKPVFDALFEGYSFVQNNPVSVSMQQMMELLEAQALEKDTETLNKFYESVKMRASGIDNAEGKQRIIIELYDKFFKTAFPKMVEKLGIVYTPVEVVDFIVQSVDDVLQKEFGRSLSDENIHILDPFTGTGTFLVRLLQSGRIRPEDLERKYSSELHANEIVLLAYYIAAVNIENAFHDALQAAPQVTNDQVTNDQVTNTQAYQSFGGICLTDTFQLAETGAADELFSDVFRQNSERVERQKHAPLRVIIGNPPYSVGQTSANDNAQNQDYPKLNSRIAATYAARTNATNKNSLYDSYFKAFRWSSDRLNTEHGGIVAFVSNGAWLDGNAQDGFRKCLQEEFSAVYVFNLRGNQRTSGELSRKEGGKIFGSGSRTPIAITILVKKPQDSHLSLAIGREDSHLSLAIGHLSDDAGTRLMTNDQSTNDQVTNDQSTNDQAPNDQAPKPLATIYYHDIGDYLSREEKLKLLRQFRSAGNPDFPWKELTPNEHGDWISQRKDVFATFIPLGDKDDTTNRKTVFVPFYSNGLKTQRDAWCYNSSQTALEANIRRLLGFYNEQRTQFQTAKASTPNLDVKRFLSYDTTQISWTRALEADVVRNREHHYDSGWITDSVYRPFFKQKLYFSRAVNEMVYQIPKLFPAGKENRVICVQAPGGNKEMTALMSDCIPDLHFNGDTQCFPLYYYEERESKAATLFGAETTREMVRRDGVSDYALEEARKRYGKIVTKEDVFYYVYGLLHSPEYRAAFGADLKKMLPRLPWVSLEDFWKFAGAGRKLGDLHCNYEKVPAADVEVEGAESEMFTVEKMRFPAKDRKDTIHFNSRITISNIPDEAYEYIVNGKSAIEWVMERYAVTTHKESGIRNDPNDWAAEHYNPRYILDVLLSVINVSVQTVEIVRGLPKLQW
ncbi:MAG: DEAD/DEAH box helicase family protein [Candidatus Kapabacteria bacterium]|nr:DEAD/DEAH box helicase family protein [Candidatus Kapabacteria bacterium]